MGIARAAVSSQTEDGRGRPWQDTRAVLNGVFSVLRTGAAWHDLTVRYSPYQPCHRPFQQWQRSGPLAKLPQKLAEDLRDRRKIDLSEAFMRCNPPEVFMRWLLVEPSHCVHSVRLEVCRSSYKTFKVPAITVHANARRKLNDLNVHPRSPLCPSRLCSSKNSNWIRDAARRHLGSEVVAIAHNIRKASGANSLARPIRSLPRFSPQLRP